MALDYTNYCGSGSGSKPGGTTVLGNERALPYRSPEWANLPVMNIVTVISNIMISIVIVITWQASWSSSTMVVNTMQSCMWRFPEMGYPQLSSILFPHGPWNFDPPAIGPHDELESPRSSYPQYWHAAEAGLIPGPQPIPSIGLSVWIIISPWIQAFWGYGGFLNWGYPQMDGL